MQWFGHSEKMEENAWSSKRRTFKISDSFSRRRRISGLKERKVNKGQAKDRNASKSFIRNRPTNANIENTLKRIWL